MKRLSEMSLSSNARLPQANLTNANHLFGDPSSTEVGDIEDGDYDSEEGDNLYGDPDMLTVYSSISGDPDDEETGDFRGAVRKVGQFIKKRKKPLLIAGGALAAGGAALLVRNAIKRKQAAARVQKQLASAKANQTIRHASVVQSSLGKMAKNSLINFFSLKGAKLNQSPIDPLSSFVADMLKVMLDRQNSDTPFLQETAIGAFAAGTWTATATGVATNRFYVGLILQIGTNILNAAPGTVVNVTGTYPTTQGNLVIGVNPFLLTYENQYDVRFLFFPWILVSNKPLPVLGQYSNAANIVAVVTGIPAASSVNLVVPGSQHPWTVAMRNALI